ncbi:MAG: MFS transporter [Spirochaetales bacterium]|nr:MFS transporter [Spirochaetales bacterium]
MTKENIQLSAVQWLYWSSFGLLFMFLVAYLEGLGYAAVEIGIVMGVISAAAMAGQPFWGVVADRTGRIGTVLWSLMLASAALSVPFLLVGNHIVLITVLAATIAFTLQALAPVIDSWTMHYYEVRPAVNYGFSRAMGSVGFSLSVAVAGRVYDTFGIELMFPSFAVGCTMAAGCVALTNRGYRRARAHAAPAGGDTPTHDTPPLLRSLRGFLKADVIAFLAVCLASFTALRAAQIFLPLLMSEIGGANTELGYALSVMAISEVPFMMLFALALRRIRDTDILLIALGFFLVRVSSHLLAATPQSLVALQAMQGPSFGLFLPASVHYMNRVAPPGAKTVAQTLAALCTFGLGSVFGSAGGGYVVETLGVRAMYGIASVLMLGTLAAYAACFYWPGWATRR